MDDREHKDYRSLGEILREARLARGRSVAELSAQTKISPKAIAALEADDLTQVAGPIYARSFTRNLAQALGLDAEFLLTKLALASPTAVAKEMPAAQKPVTPTAPVRAKTEIPADPQSREATVWRIENVRVTKLKTTRRRGVDRRLWLVVGIGLLVLVAWVWIRAASRERDVATPPRLGAPAPDEAGDSTPDDANGEMAAEGLGEAVLGGTATVTDAAQQAVPSRAGTGEEIVPPSSIRPSRPRPVVQVDSLARETAQSEAEPGLASIERPGSANAAEASSLVLVLRAVQRAEVWAAPDGRERRHRILRAGEEWQLAANDHFSLEIDDPAAVTIFLDGERRDPPPGLSGEWILYPNPAPR